MHGQTNIKFKNYMFGDVRARTMVDVCQRLRRTQCFLLQDERHCIFTVIKQMSIRKGHEAQVGEIRNAHRNLIWKFKEKLPFGKVR